MDLFVILMKFSFPAEKLEFVVRTCVCGIFLRVFSYREIPCARGLEHAKPNAISRPSHTRAMFTK